MRGDSMKLTPFWKTLEDFSIFLTPQAQSKAVHVKCKNKEQYCIQITKMLLGTAIPTF
jgi:hypothetical protein